MEPRALRRQREDWDDLARLDPLWAVLTDPGRRHGRWDLDAFFATGAAEVDRVLATAAERGLLRARGRALDFGCGVGRITRALAARFERAEGVDISPEMVRLARELNAGVPNCAFSVNVDPALPAFAGGTFDLAYSTITLQHLPSRALVRAYVAGLVRVLAPGGLLVFQMPVGLSLRRALQPKRRAYGLLRRAGIGERFLYGRLGLNPMRTISLDEGAMRRAIRAGGGEVAHAEPIPERNTSLRYYVVRP